MFTDAIEEHLALKKQNATLDASMPLARYDVGDPLDRFPGGPVRAAGDAETVVVADPGAPSPDAFVTEGDDSTQLFVGPSPEQAMEAATLLEPTAFGAQPMEPFGGGMTPLLSLVEDIEDEAETPGSFADDAPVASLDAPVAADVLRFPGGVGPRDEMPAATQTPTAVQPTLDSAVDSFAEFDAPTGEQPVLVIDTSEPLAPSDSARVMEPSRADRRRPRPRFFGLGKKKQQESAGDGWFTDGPRDFNWD
jgi:hypothetical protein